MRILVFAYFQRELSKNVKKNEDLDEDPHEDLFFYLGHPIRVAKRPRRRCEHKDAAAVRQVAGEQSATPTGTMSRQRRAPGSSE